MYEKCNHASVPKWDLADHTVCALDTCGVTGSIRHYALKTKSVHLDDIQKYKGRWRRLNGCNGQKKRGNSSSNVFVSTYRAWTWQNVHPCIPMLSLRKVVCLRGTSRTNSRHAFLRFFQSNGFFCATLACMPVRCKALYILSYWLRNDCLGVLMKLTLYSNWTNLAIIVYFPVTLYNNLKKWQILSSLLHHK